MATLQTYALTTVADVKESLGIASSNHDFDNLIIRKINQATGMIERFCGRRFKQTTYTDQIYNGTNGDQLVLKQRPVVGDVVLKARDTSLNQADFTTVDTELVYVDAESGVLDLLFRAVGKWGRYAVTYTAGYNVIPDDLAEACVSLTAFLVNNANSDNVNVKSKQEGQRKVDYSQTSVSGALDVFKRLGIDDLLRSYANNAVFADK